MSSRDSRRTMAKFDDTDQASGNAPVEPQEERSDTPAKSSDEFYRRITARDDIREILKRLAK